MTTTNYFEKTTRRFNDYSSYIKRQFSQRVQKLSLDVGFSCPNRDGTIGTGGCTYCFNKTFNPDYCKPDRSIRQQLEQGIAFFEKKYQTQKYLAYFQAYTNTYANIEILKRLYNEALAVDKIIGLAIATRPDCINAETLDLLEQLAENHYVVVEFGVESTKNETLNLINRGHNFQQTIEAIEQTDLRKKIKIGAHLILGLPSETREEMLTHARKLSELPLHTLKLHQLQIIEGTAMHKLFSEQNNLFIKFTVEQYVDLVVDFIELLNPEIIIERFISESPRNLLISPRWNLKNFEIICKIEKRLLERNTWQGKYFTT